MSMALGAVLSVLALHAPSMLPTQRSVVGQRVAAAPQMINLFGNNEESRERRAALSYRDAQPGDRKVTFRKPNQATQGLQLGLQFRESFGKAVYIDKILPNSEAARLEKQGQIKKGDEIVMVSATFGDEMWSARGVGKYRLEKSIAVRQGMTISFVVKGQGKGGEKAMKAMVEKQKKEADRVTRLQKQLTAEVEAEKKKGLFGLW